MPPFPLPRPCLLAGVAGSLIALGLVACALDVAGRHAGLAYSVIDLFHLGREQTIPAWFSSVLLLTNGFAMACVATSGSDHARRFRTLWWTAVVLFVLLSLDEAASLHERVGSQISRRAGGTHGAFRFAWVIPGAIAVVGLVGWYLRFVIDLPPRWRGRLATAAGLYVGGALGCEMIGGAIEESAGHPPLYWAMQAVEEGLEMSGQILCLHALRGMLDDTALAEAAAKAESSASVRPGHTPAA